MNKRVDATKFVSTPGQALQSQRLAQIIWVSVAAVAISLIFFAVTGWRWSTVAQLLLAALGVFIVCLWCIHKQKSQYATMLFALTLSVLACSLVYNSQGLHDEAILIFPAILLFVCMFGSFMQFAALLSALIGFLAYIVIAQEQGWHLQPDKVTTDINSFINVTVILLACGFFAYVLANDLRKALTELNRSRKELLDLNDLLEVRVDQRTEQVEAANRALQDSMNKLEHAMNELVNAEKLASLGSMVAGISHELNTPIGNTLLAASSMEKLFADVAQKIQDGNLKRTALEEFVREGQEMSALITRSTKRAADMVVSFKQVAVDQTSEQRRTFDLNSVIEDNLKALLTNYKKKHIEVVNTVPPGVECNSFPGPLGQILTNLIQNAIVHGFDERGSGTLTIHVENQNKQVILTLADDGVGMPHSVLAHVFDPFFTTKLGKGGSGLGLSISHRIATSVLGGELRAESTLGRGSTFTLVLPKVAPFPI